MIQKVKIPKKIVGKRKLNKRASDLIKRIVNKSETTLKKIESMED